MKKLKNLFLKCLIMLIITFIVNATLNLTIKATSNDDYTSLYYYSNNLNSDNDYLGYIRQEASYYGITQNNIHTFISDYETFEKLLLSLYSTGITGISNAIIIFDMSDGFYQGTISLYFTDLLCEIFSDMKENNCKIMFICGTEEIRFSTPGDEYDSEYNANRFLDYVDIHVNVDSFHPFYMSMIADIEDQTGGANFTIIFEADDLTRNSNRYLNNYESSLLDLFLDYYARKYDCYTAFVNQTGDETIDVYLDFILYYLNDFYCINVIRYNPLLDLYIGPDSTIRDYCYELALSSDIYAVAIAYNEDNISEWLDDLIDTKSKITYSTFKTYILNMACFDLDDITTSNISNLYPMYTTYGYKYSVYGSYIKHVLYDFIYEYDLSGYDNWFGRCDITYKPFPYGAGSWMRAFVYGEGEYSFDDISVFTDMEEKNLPDWSKEF
ncbi:MAG: hypothetical protein NC182_03075 [Prevotella sp.]|nr:hypothetical protein [Staphylococcus sp.]MCM1350159.1 hypothetical protein [Prevotella sp.]